MVHGGLGKLLPRHSQHGVLVLEQVGDYSGQALGWLFMVLVYAGDWAGSG